MHELVTTVAMAPIVHPHLNPVWCLFVVGLPLSAVDTPETPLLAGLREPEGNLGWPDLCLFTRHLSSASSTLTLFQIP